MQTAQLSGHFVVVVLRGINVEPDPHGIDRQASTTQAHGIEAQDVDSVSLSTPNYIQPHGVLLVLEEPDLIIVQVSNNTDFFLGSSPEALLHRPISDLFPITQVEKLKKIIEHDEFHLINLIKLCFKRGLDYHAFDGVIHRNLEKKLILELEPKSSTEVDNFLNFYYSTRTTAYRFREAQSLPVMCQLIADEIRALTGFDRVMTYQFIDGWQGTVVAEAKRADLPPYVGLHFPGSDIQPCLTLYYRDNLRMRPNISAEPVGLFPPKLPLDLSLAMLRGIGPCYQEYMANMGVQANLVLSLFKEQQLWGNDHLPPLFTQVRLLRGAAGL